MVHHHLDSNIHLGCYALLTALWHAEPKGHVFEHMHVGRGVELIRWDAVHWQKAYARRTGWRLGLVEDGNVFWGSHLVVLL